MPFTVYVEHEIVGGKTVLEEFDGVESFNNPPMTNHLHLEFAGDREEEKLSYGTVVRASINND